MSSTPYRARFHQLRSEQTSLGRITVEFVLENAGGASWTEHAPEAGEVGPVRFGYQIFDMQTGALVVDGERSALPADFNPGTHSPIRTEVTLPDTPGHYRIVLAPVHEQVAWFQDRGSDFIELRLRKTGDRIAIGSVRRMTGLRRRISRLGQMLLRSFWYPLRTFARHRTLIVSMVEREMQGRYRGSMAGAWWTLGQPLLLMLAYYFVFGVVLKAGGSHGAGAFVFYYLCGTLPWLAVSEAVGRSPNIIIDNSNFVKRVIFPVEILPVNLTLMGLLTEAFGMIIFLVAVILFGPGIGWTVIYFPAVLIPQLLFTAGLCWFLAALGVFLRDTGQVMPFLLTIWFFGTPIVYYADALPQRWLWLFKLNPMYPIVNAYRHILLDQTPPRFVAIAALWLLGLVVFWFGHSWFYKMKKSFADLI